MPIRAFCPGCRAEFHLQEDSAGTKVRCGTCLNVFEVPPDAPPVAVQASVAAEATRAPEPARPRHRDDSDRPRRRRYEDDDYDYDRPSRNRRLDRRPNNGGRTVLLILGLVFGIKFGIIALVVFFALVMAAVAPRPQPAPPAPVFVNDPAPWQQQPQFNGPGWQPPQPQPVAPRPHVGPKGFR